MNVASVVGTALGIKLVNGKLKPKFSSSAIIVIAIMILSIIGLLCALIYGVINFNIEFIIFPSIGIFGFGYLLMASPYTQKSSNYNIEFQSENSLQDFKLFYKGKLINIQYKIDPNGKVALMNNYHKIDCISYADGTKMSNLVKYKIINYFSKWLNDNNLLSSEVTVTFEKL